MVSTALGSNCEDNFGGTALGRISEIEGSMRHGMQRGFGYQLSICFMAEEKHGEP
jgi:hypothetical protein